MSISFNNIPNNIRVPLMYAEIDNSKASTSTYNTKALIFGASLKDENINTPILATNDDMVRNALGAGSELYKIYKAFRLNEEVMELWLVPLKPDEASISATGKIDITGTASKDGVISLYIGGELISVAVTKDETAENIATLIANKINSYESLLVNASNLNASVTLSAKNKGLNGNDIDLRFNYLGEIGGELTPDGISLSITSMSGGLLNPSLDTALANIGDEEFDYIGMPYTDLTSINLISEFMNDTTGRWSYSKQIYGHVFTAKSGSIADNQTFGSNLNNQHISILHTGKTPTTPFVVLGALLGRCAKSLSIDPARPLQTLELVGVKSPAIKDKTTLSERNTLLHNGISTYAVQNGVCQIERIITTYQKNKYGVEDNSYLDVETMFTCSYVLRYIKQKITSKYGRHKLANDGTRFGAGQAIVTPKVLKAEIISAYLELESAGIVENTDLFKDNLIVERNTNDPNRVDVLFPPDYVNQLRIFAVLNQFRLEY